MPALRTAIFHVESALVDRYASSPSLDELSSNTQLAEMKARGVISPGEWSELRQLLNSEAKHLASIRCRLLKSISLAEASGEGTMA